MSVRNLMTVPAITVKDTFWGTVPIPTGQGGLPEVKMCSIVVVHKNLRTNVHNRVCTNNQAIALCTKMYAQIFGVREKTLRSQRS